MPLTHITQAAAQIAQAAAVVVGGGFAYAKFVRGRTFRPRARLSVSASLHLFEGNHAVVANVSMKNEGLSRIRLEEDLRGLFVDALPADRWVPGANTGWNEDHPAMLTPIFEAHDWIE